MSATTRHPDVIGISLIDGSYLNIKDRTFCTHVTQHPTGGLEETYSYTYEKADRIITVSGPRSAIIAITAERPKES